MARASKRIAGTAPLPRWIEPQLTQLVKAVPTGEGWAHEIKYDGYRMHGRVDRGDVRLLTRTGLDWTAKYPAVARALASVPAKQVYLDGELCGVLPDGTTSFSVMQNAHMGDANLVFFLFDALHIDGENLMPLPLQERKARLQRVVAEQPAPLHYADHIIGNGAEFHSEACRHGLEGVVSKRLDAPYRPGERGTWRKTKCMNREEFVVVGWTDPEGSRPYIGALLLAYYTPDGRLVYAGRVGTGMGDAELRRLYERLKPLAVQTMPLAVPPPRKSRFGSPLVLSRVHWVEPQMVVAVDYLTWTDDGLLRQVVYRGVREDKPAREVRRDAPQTSR